MPNKTISQILNIKDKNIIFFKVFFKIVNIKGINCQVYEAKLSYKPESCTKCGCINIDNNIISHGYLKKPSYIKLNKVSNYNTYLKLHKQRFLCKECNKTFTLSTNIVSKNCFISNNIKYNIAIHATKKISEKDIASLNNVSYSTVKRTIDSYYKENKVFKNYLPKVIGFDEFKSVKSADGAMSFVFGDLVENNRYCRR